MFSDTLLSSRKVWRSRTASTSVEQTDCNRKEGLVVWEVHDLHCGRLREMYLLFGQTQVWRAIYQETTVYQEKVSNENEEQQECKYSSQEIGLPFLRSFAMGFVLDIYILL